MTGEPIAVEFFSDGLRLAGDLFVPPELDDTGKAPGVVVCHGFGGIKQFFVGDIARALAGYGYVALTFDFRGFGESEGARNRLHPQEQVEDMLAAVEFLAADPRVHGDRIGLYGTSFGGGVAVAAACRDDRVGAAVCAVGIADYGRWLRSLRRQWEWLEFEEELREDRRTRVLTGRSRVVEPEHIMVRDPHSMEHEIMLRERYPARAFNLDLASADAIRAFAPVREVESAPSVPPILFIGVVGDALTPYEETLDFFDRCPGTKELLSISGITHHEMYQPQHLAGVIERVDGFLSKHLRAGDDE